MNRLTLRACLVIGVVALIGFGGTEPAVYGQPKPSVVFDKTGFTDEQFNAGFGFMMKDLGTKNLAVEWLSSLTIDGQDVASKANKSWNLKTLKGQIIVADFNNGYVLKKGVHKVNMTVKLNDGTLVPGIADIDFK